MALVIQQEQLKKNIQIRNSYAEKSFNKRTTLLYFMGCFYSCIPEYFATHSVVALCSEPPVCTTVCFVLEFLIRGPLATWLRKDPGAQPKGDQVPAGRAPGENPSCVKAMQQTPNRAQVLFSWEGLSFFFNVGKTNHSFQKKGLGCMPNGFCCVWNLEEKKIVLGEIVDIPTL